MVMKYSKVVKNMYKVEYFRMQWGHVIGYSSLFNSLSFLVV